MTTLGVTGGIGSGKTEVCRILEGLGARVFYADRAARRIMEQDPTTRRELVEVFGDEAYTADGRLNRRRIAERVFADDEELQRLNQIVHPRVFALFEDEKAQAREDGVQLLVHEAALIYESGGDRHLDAVLVVDAPEDVRVARVVERDDVEPSQVRARMRHQMTPEELRRRADYVVENRGSRQQLRSDVEALFDRLTRGVTNG